MRHVFICSLLLGLALGQATAEVNLRDLSRLPSTEGPLIGPGHTNISDFIGEQPLVFYRNVLTGPRIYGELRPSTPNGFIYENDEFENVAIITPTDGSSFPFGPRGRDQIGDFHVLQFKSRDSERTQYILVQRLNARYIAQEDYEEERKVFFDQRMGFYPLMSRNFGGAFVDIVLEKGEFSSWSDLNIRDAKTLKDIQVDGQNVNAPLAVYIADLAVEPEFFELVQAYEAKEQEALAAAAAARLERERYTAPLRDYFVENCSKAALLLKSGENDGVGSLAVLLSSVRRDGEWCVVDNGIVEFRLSVRSVDPIDCRDSAEGQVCRAIVRYSCASAFAPGFGQGFDICTLLTVPQPAIINYAGEGDDLRVFDVQ